MATVRAWTQAQGFDYRFYDDDALQRVPVWYRDKVPGRMPIITDYLRLLLLDEALQEGYERALWFDADVLLFAPEHLQLPGSFDAMFGRECWIDEKADGKLTTHRNVHNAFCAFTQHSRVLPFLIFTTERIMARVDAAHVAPQMVGPKLLTALHNIAHFDITERIGAFSPRILADLTRGGGKALDRLKSAQAEPLAGANLCLSLVDHLRQDLEGDSNDTTDHMQDVIEKLINNADQLFAH